MDFDGLINDFSKKYVDKISSPEKQLNFLKLNLDDFSTIPGKVLVAGCGEQATLVEYLRANDIEAEGIDIRLKRDAPYLMKQKIKGTKPMPGYIPRENGYYVKVLTYMHPDIVTYLHLKTVSKKIDTEEKRILSIEENLLEIFLSDDDRKQEFENDFKELLMEQSTETTLLIMELLRVTNQYVGQVHTYPSIGELKKDIGFLTKQQGFEITNQIIDQNKNLNPLMELLEDEPGFKSLIETLNNATIIQPIDKIL